MPRRMAHSTIKRPKMLRGKKSPYTCTESVPRQQQQHRRVSARARRRRGLRSLTVARLLKAVRWVVMARVDADGMADRLQSYCGVNNQPFCTACVVVIARSVCCCGCFLLVPLANT